MTLKQWLARHKDVHFLKDSDGDYTIFAKDRSLGSLSDYVLRGTVNTSCAYLTPRLTLEQYLAEHQTHFDYLRDEERQAYRAFHKSSQSGFDLAAKRKWEQAKAVLDELVADPNWLENDYCEWHDRVEEWDEVHNLERKKKQTA